MRAKEEVRIYLILSLIGLLLVLCLPLIGRTGDLAGWQRDLTVVLLLTCYALGASMAFRPNWSPVRWKRAEGARREGTVPSRPFIGHHPDCPYFADHVVHIGEGTYCGGCLGLGLGCALSIPLSIFVFYLVPLSDATAATVLLVAGVALVAMNLIETLHGSLNVQMHVLLNALLPVAYLFIVSGVIAITGEFLNGLWAIVLGYLWLDTRKVISQGRHAAICEACPNTCKSFPY